MHGVRGSAAKGRVFEQAQIKRAVELKIGVQRPEEIKVVGLDDASKIFADKAEVLLAQ